MLRARVCIYMYAYICMRAHIYIYIYCIHINVPCTCRERREVVWKEMPRRWRRRRWWRGNKEAHLPGRRVDKFRCIVSGSSTTKPSLLPRPREDNLAVGVLNWRSRRYRLRENAARVNLRIEITRRFERDVFRTTSWGIFPSFFLPPSLVVRLSSVDLPGKLSTAHSQFI